jgi:hypothetical protein
MDAVLHWLHNNKEWVFSGCGLLIVPSSLSFAKWILKRRTINGLSIDISSGFLTFGPGLSDQMLIYTVANHSDRPMQIANIKLPLGERGNLFFPQLEGEQTLPCLIDRGTSLKFWIPANEVQASLREQGFQGQYSLHAIVVDGVGNETPSRKSVTLSL